MGRCTRTLTSSLLAVTLVLTACASDAEQLATGSSSSTIDVVAAETTTAPMSSVPTSTTLIPAAVDWSALPGVEVIESLDRQYSNGQRTRAWLLRFDDQWTVDVAQAMALEAQSYNIDDAEGTLRRFGDRSWIGDCFNCVDPEDFAGAGTVMEFLLIGGLFGDFEPDPTSPSGARLTLRTFSGELGGEPVDQIEYLIGSSRLGPFGEWEQRLVEELPGMSENEYLAAIAIDHPCGEPPAGECS